MSKPDASTVQLVKDFQSAALGVARKDRYVGPCWCDFSVGNPMVPSHTSHCEAMREVMTSVENWIEQNGQT